MSHSQTPSNLIPLAPLYLRLAHSHSLPKPNSHLLQSLKESPQKFLSTHEIDLSRSYFGARGIFPVVDLVRRLPHITHLNLSQNNLDNNSVRYLVHRLRDHPGLSQVDLSGNVEVSLGGADALLEWIEGGSGDATRFEVVDEAFSGSATLHKATSDVLIAQSHQQSGGPFRGNPRLREIYLDGTNVHEKFRVRIQEALMRNKLREAREARERGGVPQKR